MSVRQRNRIDKELGRRYEEVQQSIKGGYYSTEIIERYVNLIAHYINYAKRENLTSKSILKLIKKREQESLDKELIREGEEIIVQLKKDRNKVVNLAKKNNLEIPEYEFKEGTHSLTELQSTSFTLHFLDNFLNTPDDQQYVAEIPKEIASLRSIIGSLEYLGLKDKKIKTISNNYLQLMNSYGKKLKLQGIYDDYLRINDYNQLELLWKSVYQELDGDEGLMLGLKYGEILDGNNIRNFNDGQRMQADELVLEMSEHLQRFHNHLVDDIEDVPRIELVLQWSAQHLLPTFVSLIIIGLIYQLLKFLGIDISFDTVTNLIK